MGRGVDSSLFGVILFLCLVDRSYSGVGGVLAGIFAMVLSRFLAGYSICFFSIVINIILKKL
jgi:hypothetical protein